MYTCTGSEAEKPRRRKLSRRHSAPAAATPVSDEASDVSEGSDTVPPDDSVPPAISNLMMVEVENIVHDPYKTTEEMKVVLQLVLLMQRNYMNQ